MHVLSVVWNTTALPKPNGICHYLVSLMGGMGRGRNITMLNHVCSGPEFSWIRVIKTIPMNGKKPKTTLIILYFPVRCIIQLRTRQCTLDWTQDTNDLPSKQRPDRHGRTIGEQVKACYRHTYVATRVIKGMSHLLWTHSLRKQSGTTWGRNT